MFGIAEMNLSGSGSWVVGISRGR